MKIFWLARETSFSTLIADLNDTVNFQIPEKAISYSRWEIKDAKGRVTNDIDEIDWNVSSFYIWKMFHNKKNIYSDDFLTVLIWYCGTRLRPGTKLRIQLWPTLSEILNWKEDVEWAMSFEQQRSYILNLAKKINPRLASTIEIINIEDDHPELFSLLRMSEWTKNLSSTDVPDLDPQNYSSLSIARYLYWVMSQSKPFYDRVYKTMPDEVRDRIEKWEFPSSWIHYGMIEISFRLYNFLRWESLQWWLKRQSVYDSLIRDILYWKLSAKYYPELIDLQKFCLEIVGDRQFETLHIDNKECDKIAANQKKKRTLRSTVRAMTVVLAATLWVGWGVYVKGVMDDKKIERNIETAIDEMLEREEIVLEFDGQAFTRGSIEKKKSFLRTIIDVNLIPRFKRRYGGWNLTDWELVYLILEYIIRTWKGGEVSRIMKVDNTRWPEMSDKIVIDKLAANNFLDGFVKDFQLSLMKQWVHVNPYWKFSIYAPVFENTFLNVSALDDMRSTAVPQNVDMIERIGVYEARNGDLFNLGVYNWFMFANPANLSWEQGDPVLMLQYWKEVARLFFFNKNVEALVLDISLVFANVFWKLADASDLDKIGVALFHVKKLYPLNHPHDWTYPEILHFLQNDLMSLYAYEEEFIVPYRYLRDNAQLLENTLNAKNLWSDVAFDVSRLLGVYIHSISWLYKVYRVSKNWTDYICAIPYEEERSIFTVEDIKLWREVALDYVKNFSTDDR